MKTFIVELSLLAILSSCAYNAYTVRQDESQSKVQREVKQNDVEKDQVGRNKVASAIRQEAIEECSNGKFRSFTCSLIKQHPTNPDLMILEFATEVESIAYWNESLVKGFPFYFCDSSNGLGIKSAIAVAISPDNKVKFYSCLNDIWSEWYPIEEKKNDRY